MSIALNNDGLLLEGTAYFNRLSTTGTYEGLIELPGLAKLGISTGADIKEMISKDKDYYGQIIASVATAQPSQFSIMMRNSTQQGMALALMGNNETYSAGSGTVTDESVTADLGAIVELAQRNLTAGSVVVTSDPAGTTYVEGTDYEVNYALGLLKVLSGGAISDAANLLVDYAHGAIDGWRVRGATRTQAKGRFILDGRNLINNKTVRFEAYSVLLTSDGEIDFMADDPVEFGMTGRMETPSGKTEPFILEQW
jgi:hypothetical protein